jgi:hypothetical protein
MNDPVVQAFARAVRAKGFYAMWPFGNIEPGMVGTVEDECFWPDQVYLREYGIVCAAEQGKAKEAEYGFSSLGVLTVGGQSAAAGKPVAGASADGEFRIRFSNANSFCFYGGQAKRKYLVDLPALQEKLLAYRERHGWDSNRCIVTGVTVMERLTFLGAAEKGLEVAVKAQCSDLADSLAKVSLGSGLVGGSSLQHREIVTNAVPFVELHALRRTVLAPRRRLRRLLGDHQAAQQEPAQRKDEGWSLEPI